MNLESLSYLILALIAVYALLIGSFLNAWIWRLRNDRKVSRGRSMCPHCHTQLKWYELFPVLSFALLRGRCRTCRHLISWQYPAVELTNALLWVGLFILINPNTPHTLVEYLVWIAVSSLMLAALVYDARWMELPDQFTLPAILIAAVWLVVRWVGYGESALAISQLIGAALFTGFFGLMWYGSRGKWLGDGDIRLALLMGLLLTPTQLVIAIFMSYALGACIGLLAIGLRIKKRTDPIAFGPFLIIGLFVGYIWGERLVNLYFRLLT